MGRGRVERGNEGNVSLFILIHLDNLPNNRGMSPAAAELMYIKLAQQLPEYGHEAFQVLDIHGSIIWIGACFIGIFVKHSNGQPNIYFK